MFAFWQISTRKSLLSAGSLFKRVARTRLRVFGFATGRCGFSLGRCGFTLVELLVVIAIIGMLMAMLLPAVSSVRDSMRRTQCKNNLAQLGRASQAHVAKLGYFPSSGWGYGWVGDPDRGFGAHQPGGWLYNLLPFLGFDTIHDIGKGVFDVSDPNYVTNSGAKAQALTALQTAVVPVFICPSRRSAITYPVPAASYLPQNSVPPPALSKSDYAANGGSHIFTGPGPSPGTNCFKNYPKCIWANSDSALTAFDGVSGERSEVRDIPDGQSYVFLAGEKFMYSSHYTDSLDAGDYAGAYAGNDYGTDRWVGNTASPLPPMLDVQGPASGPAKPPANFGGPHTQGAHFVFCDGSVKAIGYNIDFAVYQSLGVRNDGNPATDSY